MSDEWVMVPREPTANQLVDGGYEIPDPMSHRGERTARMVYRAMLDAAPAAPPMTDSEMDDAIKRDEAEQERAHVAYLRGIDEGKRQAAAPQQAEPVTVLPDGSAFFTASMPLPDDHWIFAPRGEWDNDRDCYAEIPLPILTHAQRDAVTAAIRYAVRGATDCGAAMDFDPDALVQNAVYALCGPFSKPKPSQEPVAQIGWADEFGNLFPMGAWKPTQRTHHDSHKTAWRPVFLHPPAAEVQKLRDALDEIESETQDVSIQQIARKALEGK